MAEIELTDAELRALFDDPEFRVRGEQQAADWQHVVARWPQLQGEYPHEFVVMHKGEVVAHGPEFDHVVGELKRLRLNPGEGVVEWISLPGDPPLLL